jgi:hypothetical protein
MNFLSVWERFSFQFRAEAFNVFKFAVAGGDAAQPHSDRDIFGTIAKSSQLGPTCRPYSSSANAITLSPVTALLKKPPPVAVITTYCFPLEPW